MQGACTQWAVCCSEVPEACLCLPEATRGCSLSCLCISVPGARSLSCRDHQLCEKMVCVGQLSGLAQSIAAPRASIPLRQAARISRQVVRAQRSAPCQQEQASTSQRYQAGSDSAQQSVTAARPTQANGQCVLTVKSMYGHYGIPSMHNFPRRLPQPDLRATGGQPDPCPAVGRTR